MLMGAVFHECNDAFDLNTALKVSRREQEMEHNHVKACTGPSADCRIARVKEGVRKDSSLHSKDVSHKW